MNKYFILLSFFAVVGIEAMQDDRTTGALLFEKSVRAMQENTKARDAKITRALVLQKSKDMDFMYKNELRRKESDKLLQEKMRKRRKELDSEILARTKLSK